MNKHKGFNPLETECDCVTQQYPNVSQKPYWYKKPRSLTGFTLIELLMVIAIVSLLLSVIMGQLNSAREKGRIAAIQTVSSSFHNSIGDSLVGEWKFNECSGSNANDTSGFNNIGTLSGSPIWSSNTVFNSGCSLSFDGTNYVDVVDSDSLSVAYSITVSAWVKLDGSSQQSMIRKGSDWYFIFDGTKPKWYVDTIPGYIVIEGYLEDASLSVNEWHHIVGTYDGSIVSAARSKMYIDGRKARIQGIDSGPGPIVQSSDPLRIGNWSTDTFSGSIDNVRLYSKVLTVAQIQKLYAEGLKKHQMLAANK